MTEGSRVGQTVSYAVMELLSGQTLRDRFDSGPLPQKLAVDYAIQIAKGLSAAHEKGIVHRDLKPENLFVSKDGHVKILDFGLAKRIEKIDSEGETNAPTQSNRTEPGTVMGTMGYMSPEQVRGRDVDHRSDIFSFGAILYGDGGISEIVTDNLFDKIHADPRWLPFLRKIGKAPEQLAKIEFKVTLK